VRGGSFIPMSKAVQNTNEYTFENLEIHYYYDENVKNNSQKIYNDDGKTPNSFENGKYENLIFESQIKDKNLVILITNNIGKNFVSKDKNLNLVVHNAKIKKVLLATKEIIFTQKNNQIIIPLNLKKEINLEIKIELE
jgi:oligosaccharide 4-alpha-D-glucosyltransferase